MYARCNFRWPFRCPFLFMHFLLPASHSHVPAQFHIHTSFSRSPAFLMTRVHLWHTSSFQIP